jgi:hypothetical protein
MSQDHLPVFHRIPIPDLPHTAEITVIALAGLNGCFLSSAEVVQYLVTVCESDGTAWLTGFKEKWR